MTLHRTPCEVIAINAEHVDWSGLAVATLVTDDGRPAMYLAHEQDVPTLARAMADPNARVAVHTYQLIVDLDRDPDEALDDAARAYWEERRG